MAPTSQITGAGATPVERAGHQIRSVASLARKLWYSYCADELYGEDVMFADADPADVVRRYYLHGECGMFAYALSLLTGWSVVNVTSPDAGPLHSCVVAPDGRYLDASGWTTIMKIKKRYGVRSLITAKVEPKAAFGVELYYDDGYCEDLSNAVYAIRMLPNRPFSARAFLAKFTNNHLAGVDMPMSVSGSAITVELRDGE